MSEFIKLPSPPEGPKIIGKIELPKSETYYDRLRKTEEKRQNAQEKRLNIEERRLKLKDFVSSIATETNERFKTDFLDSSGRINMSGYIDPGVGEDRLYSAKDIAQNLWYSANLEATWSSESGLSLKEWQEKRERKESNSLEMMIAVIFHKFLNPRFVIAGTSKFDDYARGADQVIVDTETGAAICNLDDMKGMADDIYGNNKKRKITEAAKKGGTSIKYGFTFRRKSGKDDLSLIRRPLHNLPTFCMSVSSEETEKLLEEMSYDKDRVSDIEKKVFSKLLGSLESQYSMLSATDDVPHPVRKNLEAFKSSLEAMRNIATAKSHES